MAHSPNQATTSTTTVLTAPTTRDNISHFTDTARILLTAGGVEATLQAIADLAVSTIDGCDCAGIFVLKDERVTASVYTDPIVAKIDSLQLQAEEGPCLEAAKGKPICYAEDLADDPRWPCFGPEATAAGMRSLLALRLASDGTTGALNLYARCPAAFGSVDRAKGIVLAGLAGLALTQAKTRDDAERAAENLNYALHSRELIGQAQGILMERERITANQAFDILKRASQHLDIKLNEVAQELVNTGEQPRVSGPPPGR